MKSYDYFLYSFLSDTSEKYFLKWCFNQVRNYKKSNLSKIRGGDNV